MTLNEQRQDEQRQDEQPELPHGLQHVRTTPVFSEKTVPSGLLAAHEVSAGVWGRLVVRSGALKFVFEDQPSGRHRVSAGQHMVIPPTRPHHLELDGPATFYVEFHRHAAPGGP